MIYKAVYKMLVTYGTPWFLWQILLELGKGGLDLSLYVIYVSHNYFALYVIAFAIIVHVCIPSCTL